MSKQSNNIALLCASMILGFSQVSFAADGQPEPQLVNIPPPPSLRASNGESMAGSVGTNPNSAASLVGMPRDTAPSTEVAKNATPQKGLFANNGNNNAAANQHTNAAAVNAETQEIARKAAQGSAIAPSIRWGSQLLPAANTFYVPSGK